MSYTPDVSMFPYFEKSSVKVLAELEQENRFHRLATCGMDEEIEKLKKENLELSKKSNAKSDIIRNMMDKIVAEATSGDLDDGFYISREWGNKYIDEWNKIVSEELNEVIKDINRQNYEDEDFCLDTRDGFQFDYVFKQVYSDEE